MDLSHLSVNASLSVLLFHLPSWFLVSVLLSALFLILFMFLLSLVSQQQRYDRQQHVWVVRLYLFNGLLLKLILEADKDEELLICSTRIFIACW